MGVGNWAIMCGKVDIAPILTLTQTRRAMFFYSDALCFRKPVNLRQKNGR